MRKTWSEEEDSILTNTYTKGGLKLAISSLDNRSAASIMMRVNKLGIKSGAKFKGWDNDENQIFKDYYIYGAKKVKELLPHRTIKSIQKHAFDLGLNSDPYYTNAKYSHNRGFFDTPNNLNSYWAGFIAADGYISSNDHHLGIGLSVRDLGHLEKFKHDIEYTGPIYAEKNDKEIKSRNGKTYIAKEMRVLRISSSQNIQNMLLANWNITKRKTLTLMPPNITDRSLVLSYIAGYIDGDGSILSRGPGFYISMLGTQNLLTWIEKELKQYCYPNIDYNRKIHVTSTWSSIEWSSKISSLIIKEILQIDNIPLLARKWDKVKCLL